MRSVPGCMVDSVRALKRSTNRVQLKQTSHCETTNWVWRSSGYVIGKCFANNTKSRHILVEDRNRAELRGRAFFHI
jgi:hypothetical protein